MIFNLDILDTLYAPLNVSNINVGSQTINLTDLVSETMSVSLEAGNNYNLVIPLDANAPSSVVLIEFTGDPTLNFTTTSGQLATGLTVALSPVTDVTAITFNSLDVNPETYDQTVSVNGENIQIELTDGTTVWNFAGTNSVSQVMPDNSSIDISVISSGLITYKNTVATYTNDVDASVLMQPVITNNTHPDFRMVYPHFFVVVEPCTYTVHLYDGQASDWGTIVYDENNTDFSTGARNIAFSACGPSSLDFTQTISVYKTGHCGNPTVLMFPPKSWTLPVVTTTEYKPELTLNRPFGCCETLDEVITVFPVSMELREGTIHDHCDIDTSASIVLEYKVTAPDGSVIVDVSYTGLVVEANTLDSLTAIFTPTQLGSYKIVTKVSNCCETITYEDVFDSCNSWVVTNSNCNVININNLSVNNGITYTIKQLTDYDTFENVTNHTEVAIVPGGEIDIDLVNDNLYTVTIIDSHISTNDDEKMFLLDCKIKKCKKQFLLDVLCDNLDSCDKNARLELFAEFAEFKVLEDIVYQKWDEWKLQQSIVDTFSVNDIMEDVVTLSKAMSSMSKICNECTTLKDQGCGCS